MRGPTGYRGAWRRLVSALRGSGPPAISPLAPPRFPDLPQVVGATFATAATGTTYRGRPDLMLAHLAPGTSVAGIFTRSATRSAAVLDCQEKIDGEDAAGAAILVNAGNANAFTGRAGTDGVTALARRTGDVVGLPADRIFTASTGVIGEPLATDGIATHLAGLAERLSPGGMADAAQAIMTTDTFPKGAGARVDMGGVQVGIAGIAKGSGMIAPDMATMLAFIFTDAAIPQAALQTLLSELSRETFNAITVDGDTSTSDTALLCATGASGAAVDTGPGPFRDALASVMRDLAQQIVRDGEGATKFVEVRVTGAASEGDARRVARSVSESPLVKTAIAGSDPNWGRIVMAVGKSGAAADRDRLAIRFGDLIVAHEGWRAPSYDEAEARARMTGQHVEIGIDLGLGKGEAVMWTCDLTDRYIAINTDYRS